MLLRHFFDRDLAQFSYMLGCQATGQALIVDPMRHVKQYVRAAADEGLRIQWVTETHIHADFVSGARELAAVTGARLLLSDEGGPDWAYGFDHEGLKGGDVLEIGNLRLDVRHTPGHTPEHLSFVVTDSMASDRPMGAFTGDFLFVGDVGRPDLLETAAGAAGAARPSAVQLFNSLRGLAELPDYLQIWPGHGAGSACGKALGAVPSTTLGYERLVNWAFQIDDESEFVEAVLAGQPATPRYFGRMKRINRDGPPLLADGPRPDTIDPADLPDLAAEAVILDVRPLREFSRAHIPGSIGVPLGANFGNYAGSVVPYDRPLALIAHPEDQDRALRQLHSIGLDQVLGVAPPAAVDAWPDGSVAIDHVTVDQVAEAISRNGAAVLDVRQTTEYEEGHVPGGINIPLQTLADSLEQVPADGPLYVHCATGHRSVIATSVLEAAGFRDVTNIRGGFSAWERAGLPEAE